MAEDRSFTMMGRRHHHPRYLLTGFCAIAVTGEFANMCLAPRIVEWPSNRMIGHNNRLQEYNHESAANEIEEYVFIREMYGNTASWDLKKPSLTGKDSFEFSTYQYARRCPTLPIRSRYGNRTT